MKRNPLSERHASERWYRFMRSKRMIDGGGPRLQTEPPTTYLPITESRYSRIGRTSQFKIRNDEKLEYNMFYTKQQLIPIMPPISTGPLVYKGISSSAIPRPHRMRKLRFGCLLLQNVIMSRSGKHIRNTQWDAL